MRRGLGGLGMAQARAQRIAGQALAQKAPAMAKKVGGEAHHIH